MSRTPSARARNAGMGIWESAEGKRPGPKSGSLLGCQSNRIESVEVQTEEIEERRAGTYRDGLASFLCLTMATAPTTPAVAAIAVTIIAVLIPPDAAAAAGAALAAALAAVAPTDPAT